MQLLECCFLHVAMQLLGCSECFLVICYVVARVFWVVLACCYAVTWVKGTFLKVLFALKSEFKTSFLLNPSVLLSWASQDIFYEYSNFSAYSI